MKMKTQTRNIANQTSRKEKKTIPEPRTYEKVFQELEAIGEHLDSLLNRDDVTDSEKADFVERFARIVDLIDEQGAPE